MSGGHGLDANGVRRIISRTVTIPFRSSVRLVVVAVLALGMSGSALAQAPGPSGSNPVMTEELMGRVITRTLASKKNAKVPQVVSGFFGLNDGKSDLATLEISKKTPAGIHAFDVSLSAGFNDILISFAHDGVVDVYLTDRTAVLRAAASLDSSGIRRISNAQALPKYMAELAVYAALAATLPPAKH